jgi:serine/threonine protein kinase
MQLESASSPLWQLRAIDFGTSCFVQDGEPLTQVAGSPHYVAPEVLK